MRKKRTIKTFTLENENGLKVELSNVGAAIASIQMPDRFARVEDITLGFPSIDDHIKSNLWPYFGGIIGRYANRIREGRFTLDGNLYQLSQNQGRNHLHGGTEGFDRKLWHYRKHRNQVIFTLHSGDGEEGYPGNLLVEASYTLNRKNILELELKAETDKPTIINLTNHVYFNLHGLGRSPILNHKLWLNADFYAAVDKFQIPTGELCDVANSPFDFRTPTRIIQNWKMRHPQISIAKGFDHSFLLRDHLEELKPAATIAERGTGRSVELWTTQPAVHLYTGNFLDGNTVGRHGRPYFPRSGLCLECQSLPDSPNHPNFPSTVLTPERPYRSLTQYRFKWKD